MSDTAARNSFDNTIKLKIIDHLDRFSKVGYWHYDVGANKLYWSDRIYEIHGLIPGLFRPTLEKIIDLYHPGDRDQLTFFFTDALENRRCFDFRLRIVRPDGEVRTVSCQASVETGTTDPREDPKVVALYGTFQDITNDNQQQNLYEMAAIASSTAVWNWDIRSDIITWAGQSHALLGTKTNQDLPEKSEDFFQALVHPDDREKFMAMLRNHLKKNEKFEIEIRVRRFDLGYTWFLARAQAQWDANGTAISAAGVLTDIGELKKTQEKLAKSNRDLEQFAAIASHDLKQPLRSISGFMEILQMKYADKLDDDAQKYINFAVKSAQDMNDLINDLLEYSKLDTVRINYEKVSSEALIKGVIENLHQTIIDKNARVEMLILPSIDCDPKKMHRVFYNLIENGIKYNRTENPVVTIESYPTPHAWVFTISDNGIGIAAEKAEEIFKMFSRLHNKGEFSGSGVGLAICKKIIELHGGEIWVEPNQPNGSRFLFTIPFKASVGSHD